MFDQKKIGAFLAEERKKKNLTQTGLAEKLGVSNRSVSRWENGKTMPDYALLPPLCEALGISVNELFAAERLPAAPPPAPQYDENVLRILKEYHRMKKNARTALTVLLIVGAVLLALAVRYIVSGGLVAAMIFGSFSSAKVEEYDDPAEYSSFMGENARKEFRSKWGMDETIFPSQIPSDAKVLSYKMVYYDPWDAQYLSYLVLEYGEEAYEKECARLAAYPSTPYQGYYGVTGFSKYRLLAMYADDYQGFVYALTDGEGTIIYAELIFCNYCFDLDYEKYIPAEYLPDGFDARIDNAYGKAEMARRTK
ncbi:MAG: helix-turn-helix transcriptional regulator [Clostridia bacterium]|nr:helix-turn-helix transcriptional regulator [Clostridia bacterium]